MFPTHPFSGVTVPVSGFLIVTRRLRDCVKSRNGEGKGERHIRSAFGEIGVRFFRFDLLCDFLNAVQAGGDVYKRQVEGFMNEVKTSLGKEENVYLRGFGSFIVKKRAQKTARNISKNTTMIIPAHNIPAFKPSDEFLTMVKMGKQ